MTSSSPSRLHALLDDLSDLVPETTPPVDDEAPSRSLLEHLIDASRGDEALSLLWDRLPSVGYPDDAAACRVLDLMLSQGPCPDPSQWVYRAARNKPLLRAAASRHLRGDELKMQGVPVVFHLATQARMDDFMRMVQAQDISLHQLAPSTNTPLWRAWWFGWLDKEPVMHPELRVTDNVAFRAVTSKLPFLAPTSPRGKEVLLEAIVTQCLSFSTRTAVTPIVMGCALAALRSDIDWEQPLPSGTTPHTIINELRGVLGFDWEGFNAKVAQQTRRRLEDTVPEGCAAKVAHRPRM